MPDLKKPKKHARRMSYVNVNLSTKRITNNQEKELVRVFVDRSFNKRARAGGGAAVLCEGFSITLPPLKSVDIHLNIKSSALKSADGVDFTACAPLS